MRAASDRSSSSPLVVPELVGLIVSHVDDPADLLNCACVNSTWSVPALVKLYRGSMHDMRYRTPDIGSLNSLFIVSRERFARNMSLVKHLVIAPENPALDDASQPSFRYACVEKCRPLRDRKSAELLLRPRGQGPVSLAIPLELVNQDLSAVSDLLLHPGLKSLTIDYIYCELLRLDSGPLEETPAPITRLSNLAALSIYRSDSHPEIANLCEWLERCDLELFQINERQELDGLSRSYTTQLLRCLRRHRKLRALALMMHRCETGTGEICADLDEEEGTVSWPGLKALYLGLADRHWLEKLPTFKELRILRLRHLVSPLPDVVGDAARSISRCRHLRAIDIAFRDVDDAELLVSIARGCPLLQGFCVNTGDRAKELTGDQFSRLLRALPRLEFLSLGVRFRMTGSELRDLADSCPRLAILELFRTRLYLSLESLAEAPPLRCLGVMKLREVWFDDPTWYMRLSRLWSIAREWTRVFPSIRDFPCPADVYGPPVDLEGSSSSEESEDDGDSESPDGRHGMDLDEPGLDFEDYDSDWFNLRRRLWMLIGYGTNTDTFERSRHMWQTRLEIETLGWPMLPMEAFLNPDQHSTSEKHEC